MDRNHRSGKGIKMIEEVKVSPDVINEFKKWIPVVFPMPWIV